MGPAAITIVAVIALALLTAWLWRRRRTTHSATTLIDAQRQFAEQRPDLPAVFLHAASQTGKPRGLSWEKCELNGEPVFARDRATGELYALVGATISFAAIPGGGMEDVEAVGNLRYATAVFIHRAGSWQSDGQAVFNLEPPQALQRYAQTLSPVA